MYSNYYFSKESPSGAKYYHSTTFQGFKKEYLKGTALRIHGLTKTYVKKIIYKLTNKSISTDHHKKI